VERNLKEIFILCPKIFLILFLQKIISCWWCSARFLLKKPFFDFDFILPKDDFSSLEYTLEKERLKFILLNKKEFPLYRVF